MESIFISHLYRNSLRLDEISDFSHLFILRQKIIFPPKKIPILSHENVPHLKFKQGSSFKTRSNRAFSQKKKFNPQVNVGVALTRNSTKTKKQKANYFLKPNQAMNHHVYKIQLKSVQLQVHLN